ncbi:MAG: hypothetical protein C5B54_10980 [Acidobacteria bacterium]|nr:MAG: hypothetical protein C5B54_10980 [Acidobacteriota bacterium]
MKTSAVVFLVLTLAFLAPFNSFAASKQGGVQGRVYDVDKSTEMKGVPVHLVSADSGKAYETQTNKDGCYDFDKIPQGTYSVSASVSGKDYLLTDKIIIADSPQSVCVALADGNQLTPMDSCKACRKKFPVALILLAGGGAAAIATGVAIGGGTTPEASPSTP